ncbi:hypothetical protein [Micromonospora sp. NPDC051006]|uniref:hypothetical protein n=1 Tax=Micromonospora sp. NPDC051006 TaxID=3364283 RepID=UPI0037A54E47
MGPRHLRRQFASAVLLVLAGLLVLVVPASLEGPVKVPISAGHGLSVLDFVGAVALTLGGTWLEVLVVWRLPTLRLPPRALFGLGALAGLGTGLVLASAFSGFFWWWAVGAAAVGVAAVVLIPLAALR